MTRRYFCASLDLEDVGIQQAELYRMLKLILRPHETERDQYRVMGLSPGHNTLVRFENGEWWIRHTDDSGQRREWVGIYESAKMVVAALEEALSHEEV